MFLKISQYPQEKTCVGVFFNEVIKKRPKHRCFPLNIEKKFKNSFFYRTSLMTASEFLKE